MRRGHRGGDADHRTGETEAGPAPSLLGMAARPAPARADRDRRRRRLPALPRLGKLVAGRRGGTATVTAVTAYDPFGTGAPGENNAQAPLATDGNESTYWPTETYRASFAELDKPGVGLVLRVKGSGKPSSIVVTTDTPGFTAEIKAGNSDHSFTQVVSSPQVVSATTTFAIGGNAQPYYLLWITNLGPHQADHVNEVRAG